MSGVKNTHHLNKYHEYKPRQLAPACKSLANNW